MKRNNKQNIARPLVITALLCLIAVLTPMAASADHTDSATLAYTPMTCNSTRAQAAAPGSIYPGHEIVCTPETTTTPPAIEPPVTIPESTPPAAPKPEDDLPDTETPPVVRPPVELEIRENPSTMTVGDTAAINFVLKNADENTKLRFTSSNPQVVSVDDTGKLTALSAGSAAITISAGAETRSVLIDVTAKHISAESLKIEVSEFGATELVRDVHALKIGDRLHLSALVTPNDADLSALTWRVSDEAVLRLDAAGVLTALSEGTAQVTLALGTKSASLSFSVASGRGEAQWQLWGIFALMILIMTAAVVAGLYLYRRKRLKEKAEQQEQQQQEERRQKREEAEKLLHEKEKTENEETFWDVFDYSRTEPRDSSTKIFTGPLIPDGSGEPVPKKEDGGYEDGPDKPFSLHDVD